MTTRTGLGQDNCCRTASTGQPGRIVKTGQLGLVSLDRSDWTDREDRTPRT
jgi:hypothetical protein